MHNPLRYRTAFAVSSLVGCIPWELICNSNSSGCFFFLTRVVLTVTNMLWIMRWWMVQVTICCGSRILWAPQSTGWFVDILLLGIQMYQIKQGKNLSCSQEKCFVEMQRLWAFQIRDLIFSTNWKEWFLEKLEQVIAVFLVSWRW